MIRKPIITILGHVDHGKTKLLDSIRKTTVVDREAGAITQAIGASIVPLETIQRMCGSLLKKLNLTLTIPGLLFIDTPGHAAFANLRKRGGNLADIAIIVIDINEGLMPQTIEAIEIMKSYKTPFVIALNKIDMINGWKTDTTITLLENISKQEPYVTAAFETKFYEVVGKIYELGFEADRFDRVSNYTKQLAMIPISARSTEGLAELLMVVAGLTQRYLNDNLQSDIEKPAKGIILEVKEEQGLGKTIDVIIYDGYLQVNDTIVIGCIPEPIVTKVRALFEPQPLQEMRDKKSKFISVKKATAATGIKIAAPELDNAVAGMPLTVCNNNKELDAVKEEIQKEIEEVVIQTEKNGIIVKADTLGSLEAMICLLKERKVAIRKATIGDISRNDVSDAESNKQSEPLNAVILAFNVTTIKEAVEYSQKVGVKVLTNNVIYRLLEEFDIWLAQEKKNLELKEMQKITLPCKARILPNHIFRQSNPAIVGMDIMAGVLRLGTHLFKEPANNPEQEGKAMTKVKSLKTEKDVLQEAKAGQQIAVALDDVIAGRHIFENDVFYSAFTEEEFRAIKEHKNHLKKQEIEVLREIAAIMRRKNPLWGI